MSETEALGSALPKEIQRCMDLLPEYEKLGMAGAFGFAMIHRDIADALKAIAENDPVAMLRAYDALKGCK